MRKCSLLLFLFTLVNGEFTGSSSLIDIPTAYVLKDGILQATFVGSFALDRVSKIPYDFDFSIGYGIGNMVELSITGYTFKDYALGFTWRIIREKKYNPMIAIGIQDITYRKFISSLGGGDSMQVNTWCDDTLVEQVPSTSRRITVWRAPENMSVFGVASKTFGKYTRLHIGIGRGRYVGYETFARNFNTDIWSPNAFHESAFGLFWGFEINYEHFLDFALEFDGRDINLGCKISFEYWELYAAWTKLEHAFSITPCSPRMVVGINLHTPQLTVRRGGEVKGFVKTEKRPVRATVYLYSETKIFHTVTDKRGFYRFTSLAPGEYKIFAKARGYRAKPVIFKISYGERKKIDLFMRKAEGTGIIRGRIYGENKRPLHAKVMLLETGEVTETNKRTGEYVFYDLVASKYTVEAEAEGYFPRRIACKVEEGKETRLDINLSKHWIIFYFKPGEGMIEPRYIPVLEDAVRFLKRHPEIIVEIQGHTDSVGDASRNLELSRKRAEAVRKYFVERGIAPSRLIAKGYGEHYPIADNRTILGRDLNRRVELVIIR